MPGFVDPRLYRSRLLPHCGATPSRLVTLLSFQTRNALHAGSTHRVHGNVARDMKRLTEWWLKFGMWDLPKNMSCEFSCGRYWFTVTATLREAESSVSVYWYMTWNKGINSTLQYFRYGTRRRDLYLTTRYTNKRQTSTPLAGFVFCSLCFIHTSMSWLSRLLPFVPIVQHTQHKLPCPRRDSNPQSSKLSAADPRLRPLGHWDRHNSHLMLSSCYNSFGLPVRQVLSMN
jgi:hypothetical protein